MFDLEREIGIWRNSMTRRLPVGSEASAELESHLRDAVQRNVETGMSLDAAWNAALIQLGDADRLAAEFQKVSSPRILRWVPLQVVAGIYAVFTVLLTWACARSAIRSHDSLLVGHVWSISLGYAAVFAVAAISAWSIVTRACRGWTSRENELYLRASRWLTLLSLGLCVGGVYLGGIWIRNQQRQVWIVDYRELGGVAIVAWNLACVLVLGKATDARTAMRFGLINGALVIGFWLIPAMCLPLAEYGLHGTCFGLVAGICILGAALAGLTSVEPGGLRMARQRVA